MFRRSSPWWAALLALAAALSQSTYAAPPAAPAAAPSALLGASAVIGRSHVDVVADPGSVISATLLADDGTRKAASEPTTIPGIGRADLGFLGTDDEPVPMLSGDRVRLVVDGELVIESTLPTLTADADVEADLVTGTAPPGTEVVVRVAKFPAQRAEGTITVSAGGNYSFDFADDFDIGRGTELTATVKDGLLEISAWWQFREAVSATFWSSSVDVKGPSGVWVRGALVHAGDDHGAWGDVSRLGTAGTAALEMVDEHGNPAAVLPGDAIHLEFVGMVSRRYTLPNITADADSETDSVWGTAPPGASISVAVDRGLFDVTAAAVADGNGRYSVDFAGKADIVPGGAGIATASVGDEIEVSRVWGLTRLTVHIGQAGIVGLVAGVGPPVELRLYDAEGFLRAGGSATVTPTGARGRSGEIDVQMRTLEAVGVPLIPGYVVELKRGGETVSLEIPQLTIGADTEADLVEGVALPGSLVDLTIGHALGSASREATAGQDGRYSLDLTGNIDIRGGRTLSAEIRTPEGHIVKVDAGTGALLVWTEIAAVTGQAGVGKAVSALIESGSGSSKASGSGSTDATGKFSFELRDAGGSTYRPSPGETISADLGGNPVSLVIPEVTAQPDLDTDEVSGHAKAVGNVWVLVRPPEGENDEAATKSARIFFDSAFNLKFAGTADLRPASRLRVTFRDGDGNGVAFDRTVHMVNVQVGGDAVHGYGMPHDIVQVVAKFGGSTIAAAEHKTGADQQFRVNMTDDGGRPLPIVPGTQIEVSFGAGGEMVTVPVSPITAQLDSDAWSVKGAAPADASLEVRRVTPRQPDWRMSVTAGESGSYIIPLPDWPAPRPGEHIEVDHRVGDGHRVYALANSLRIAAFIGTDEVLCTAGPLSPVRVVLEQTSGAPISESTGETDTRGSVLVQTGGGARLAPGLILHLHSDEKSVTMVIPSLTASVSRDSGSIKGTLGPGNDVWPLDLIAYMRPDRTPIHTTIEIGLLGRYLMDPYDQGGYPPLYEPDDVMMVETWLTVPNGNQAVARAWPSTWLNIPFIKKQ